VATHRLDWSASTRDDHDTVRVPVEPAPDQDWEDALSVAHSSRSDECRSQVYDQAYLMSDTLVITETPVEAEQPTQAFFDMVVSLADRTAVA
jgi:hypothetical protein